MKTDGNLVKAPLAAQSVNQPIRRWSPEVMELTRREAVKTGVSVQMHFAEGLPLLAAIGSSCNRCF